MYYKVEITRKDLKIHEDCKAVVINSQPGLADNIDLMPVVLVLSLVFRERMMASAG